MKAGRAVIGVGALLMAVGLVPTAYGQEAARPDLLLTITETLHQVDTRLVARDDLRDLQAPRVDRLSEAVRLRLIVSDPQCLPGETAFGGPGRLGRRPSRPHY